MPRILAVFLILVLGLSDSVFALRQAGVEGDAVLNDLRRSLAGPIQPAGAEEAQKRLDQLAQLQGNTGAELREALWVFSAEALDLHQPNWTRESLLKAIQEGRRIIPIEGMSAVKSPWGDVDLSHLNDRSRYPADGAAYLIVRDIEIAVALGLLRVQRVNGRTGVSPSAVYKILKGSVGPVASISWPDALLLRGQAQKLLAEGTVKLGSLVFTFLAGKEGAPAEFTVNGKRVEPDEAQIQVYDALGILHYGNGHSALPASIKEVFQWNKLNLNGEQAKLLRGQAQKLLAEGTVKLGSLVFTFLAGKEGAPAEFTVNGKRVEPDEAQIQVYDALGILHYGNGHSALPASIKEVFQWSYPRSAAGLEEVAPEGPGVLVIEAGAVGELDWLEGLLAQPVFAERIVLFGGRSFEAHELAARHPGQVRFVDTDDVGDLVVELLSMPSPAVDRISYLGQPEPFRQLKNQIRPWGLEVQRLDPNAELRLILLALGVSAEALDRTDTRRLQEQLAQQRAA